MAFDRDAFLNTLLGNSKGIWQRSQDGNKSLAIALADALSTSFAGAVVSPPVGSILAWHKTFTNTPALPEGWLECNGQTVSDAASVYNGQAVPDLNGHTAATESRFLRGADTSGTLRDDNIKQHTHRLGNGAAGSLAVAASDAGDIAVGGYTGTNPAGSPDETFPRHMDVVWIIKIKDVVPDLSSVTVNEIIGGSGAAVRFAKVNSNTQQSVIGTLGYTVAPVAATTDALTDMTITFSAAAATNVLLFSATLNIANDISGGANWAVGIWRDADVDPIYWTYGLCPPNFGAYGSQWNLQTAYTPGDTSSHTYKIRAGAIPNPVTINPASVTGGGTMPTNAQFTSSFQLIEMTP